MRKVKWRKDNFTLIEFFTGGIHQTQDFRSVCGASKHKFNLTPERRDER